MLFNSSQNFIRIFSAKRTSLVKQLSTQNMSTKKVIVLNKVPLSGISYMKEQGLNVDYNDSSEVASREDLLKQVKGLIKTNIIRNAFLMEEM